MEKEIHQIILLIMVIITFNLREARANELFVPVIGESVHVYDPSSYTGKPGYINDHCVVRGADGKWHMFGIYHDVLSGTPQFLIPRPWAEEQFAHATADDLFQKMWEGHPNVNKIDKSLGETHVWAPYVLRRGDTYYMFYCGGGGHWNQMINLAVSDDLYNWTKYPDDPMFRDFYDARDPMVFEENGRYILYYTKTYSREDPKSTVAFRTSDDLIHWSDPGFALVIKEMPATIPNSQYTESPFVVKFNGMYYLFICSPDLNYKCTRVFISADPRHFEEKDEVATLMVHCAEVIQDGDKWALSHAGWFYQGLYMAPLKWEPMKEISPRMIFENAGDANKYLDQEEKAKAVPWVSRLTRQKAMAVGQGGYLLYRFPVPQGALVMDLAFEEDGATKVAVKSKVVLDERAEGKGEPTLHTIRLSEPDLWADGFLNVRIEPANDRRGAEPEINYLKLYFIR